MQKIVKENKEDELNNDFELQSTSSIPASPHTSTATDQPSSSPYDVDAPNQNPPQAHILPDNGNQETDSTIGNSTRRLFSILRYDF